MGSSYAYRALKKLDGAISVAYALPGLKQLGWSFEDDPRFPDCTPDTVNGFHSLHDAYTASDANYSGKVTVPALSDRKAGRIINNESSEIIHMLNSEFNAFTGETTDYYLPALRAEIDDINERVYRTVNNRSIPVASPNPRPPMRRLMTVFSPRSMIWTRGCRSDAICWEAS